VALGRRALAAPGTRAQLVSLMTAREFRRIALSLPQASEAAHMGHPDFRVGGRIFATLGYPRSGWRMVKLTPEQQELFGTPTWPVLLSRSPAVHKGED